MNSDRRQSILKSRDHPGLLAVSTLVLWAVCLGVGLTGLLWIFHPSSQATESVPMDAQLLTVEATDRARAMGANPSPAPASPQNMALPPPVPEVALPSPAIAFVVPAKEPARAVEIPVPVAPRPVVNQSSAPTSNPSTRPAVIQLTLGEGEGQQPAPEYPPEAVLGGEEGTVVVRFTVGEDGRVTDAAASSPCHWPVLNSAAVRAVRTTWRFSRGPVRSYEVSIEFHLNRHE